MFSTIRRKLRTIRRVSENPDTLRLFIVSRYPSISPTCYWLRWLYPAWWKYVFHALARCFCLNRRELKTDSSSRFLLRLPKNAGIGDQIVTSWSETYMLARKYGLTFVHHPFARSLHNPNTDWEEFLGFGTDEIQVQQVLQNKALKTVWLPPILLADQRNIALVGRIINQVYPQSNIIFRLASNIYFGVALDQSEPLPAVYLRKYEAARRKFSLNLNFESRCLHIGLHIRRGDVNTLRETNTDQWKWRWVSDEYYLNALGDLLILLDEIPFQVHIFSDGTANELCAFREVPHCVFHLQEDPKRAFHGMVSVDILVSSSSSFAICAGKISRGIKLIGRDFDRDEFRLFVPQTADWVPIEPTGYLPDSAKTQIRGELVRRRLASPARALLRGTA